MSTVKIAPFLTAEWRHLAMVNFEVDPCILKPLVPARTELDDWNGHTFLSLVGFLFLKTHVLGAAIPCHQNFEEVNLRFYVRRKVSGRWRRAVVFVKEIVPRRAIAWTARTVYGEKYVALPMKHRIEEHHGTPRSISYSWWLRGKENRLGLLVDDQYRNIEEGSDVEFITEHYWGYARRRGGGTTEYRVEHPRWRIGAATANAIELDAAALYGDRFVEALRSRPVSAFLAEGSEVTVFRGTPCL